MNTFTLFLLALGLSMDAFAVSVSNSMCHKDLPRRTALVTSLMFGLFQGMMPVIGYVAGRAFADAVSALDHWIAFVLLGYIGGKMLVDAVREWNSEAESCPAAMTMGVILTQAVATSIDALAVGVSLAALDIRITTAASFIACVTFLCCIAGHAIGAKFGKILGNWAQIFGGVILVGIGSKILIEHLFF